MTQTATVKRLVGETRAEIIVWRESACGHNCASCGGCASSGKPQVTVVAENQACAQPGDTVLVESESRKVLGLAVVLYLEIGRASCRERV